MTNNDDFTTTDEQYEGDPMTGQQIDHDQLRELIENATRGPWEASWAVDKGGELTVSAGDDVSTDVILEWHDVWPEDEGAQLHANAKFIAAARTAMPALLDENAELRVSLAQAEAALRRALDGNQ